ASERWDSVRVKNTQYIELIVAVDDPSGSLPGDARVVWNWEDPDDPANDGMRHEAARATDDSAGGGDNRGQCDFSSSGSAPNEPVFEEVPGFSISETDVCHCHTAIVNHQSKVRLHCTNVGGDNYVIRVQITGRSDLRVSTGVMTLWKRIDVEYHQHQGVRDIPLRRVAAAFEDAFVQLDIEQQRERFTIRRRGSPTRYMTDDENLEVAARALSQRLFRHARRPGWFLLVAADLETSLVANDPPELYARGPARLTST